MANTELKSATAHLRSVQPAGEANRTQKICTSCEVEAATSFCARCGVTPYCGRECQRKHYKSHKRHCAPNPLVSAVARAQSKSVAVPSPCRPYTDAELASESLCYVMLPGPCGREPTDRRDALCQLIVAADAGSFRVGPTAEEEGRSTAIAGYNQSPLGPRFKRVDAAGREAMGWSSKAPRSTVATGYSHEDAAFFRVPDWP